MLRAAGVTFLACAAALDEGELKSTLAGAEPQILAQTLATRKAQSLSPAYPTSLILGSDQILVSAEGVMMNKAESKLELAAQLKQLSGKTHQLISAASLVLASDVIWEGAETASLTMRPLSDAFITDYIAQHGDAVLGCVGGYQIEGEGVQLFEHIEGGYFAIMGMPLLPLLAALRDQRHIPA